MRNAKNTPISFSRAAYNARTGLGPISVKLKMCNLFTFLNGKSNQNQRSFSILHASQPVQILKYNFSFGRWLTEIVFVPD